MIVPFFLGCKKGFKKGCEKMSYINLATYAAPIILDDKGLKSGLSKAEGDVKKSTGNIAGFMKKGLAGGLAAVTGAGAGLMALTTKSAEATDRIDKMSQKIGLSKKGFQEWDFIMSQSGGSVDGLQMGMKTLVGKMDEASQGAGKGAETFSKLGLSVTDSTGQMKSQEQMFEETVASLQGMEDGTEKARLATELFGRQGSELMPLLNGATGSVEEMKQQAEDLGLVLSDDAVDAGAAFTDVMDQTQRMLASVTTTIGVSLMPVIQSFLEWVMEYMPQIKKVFGVVFGIMETLVTGFVDVLGTLISWLQTWFNENEEVLTSIKESFLTFFEIVKDFFSGFVEFAQMIWDMFGENIMNVTTIIFDTIKGIISSVFEVIKGILEVFTGIFTGDWSMFSEGLKTIWDGLWKLIKSILSGAVKLIQLAINNFTEVVKNLWTTFTDFLKDLWSGMWDGIKGIVEGAWELLKGAFGDLWTNIKNWFTDLIEDGKEWGKNLIEGFKDGIVAMAKKPVEAVKEMSENIANGVKDFFGIHSPSRLMRGYGANLSEGLALGVEDERDRPINAIKDMAIEMKHEAQKAVREINATWEQLKGGKGWSGNTHKSSSSSSGDDWYTWEDDDGKWHSGDKDDYSSSRSGKKNKSGSSSSNPDDSGWSNVNTNNNTGGSWKTYKDKDGKWKSEKYHDGGFVQGNNVFSSRMGLMKDEVPAILQRGEFVLSRKMVKDIASASGNNNNSNNNNNKATEKQDIKQAVYVAKLEFPNVRDAREIEGAIGSLSTYAPQWANKK